MRQKIYHRAGIFMFGLLMCLFLVPFMTQAAEEEQEKIVRVGYVNVPTYEEGGEGEYKTGSGYEYLQKISYFTGWKYEYVYGSFQELYEKLVNGEIDLFGNVSYTDERAELFHYATYPQGKDVYYLYTLQEREELLNGDISQLDGCTIGVTAGSYQESLLKNWLEDNAIEAEVKEYDGYDSSMAALDAGQIDAIATPALASSRYDYATIIDIGFSEYYFAVADGREDILTELNEALYQIQSGNPNYNAALESKYQLDMLSDKYLSEKEKNWLKEHDYVIRLGYLNHNFPYSGKDENGEMMGVLATLSESMEYEFELQVETSSYETQEEMREALKKGEIDAAGPCYSNYWLAEQSDLIQTNVVISSTPILFFKNSGDESRSISDVIAVSKRSFIGEAAAEIIFPEAEILLCENRQACLKAVEEGRADSTLASAAQLNLIRQYPEADGLQIAEMSVPMDICICTQKKDPQLANIINKGITAAGKSLTGTVLSQNSYVEREYTVRDFLADYMIPVTGIITVVISVLLIMVIYMVYATKRVNEVNNRIIRKQKELQEAVRRAEDANNAKTTFLTNMSHDIRTPINGIVGMLDIIERTDGDEEKTENCLGKIRQSANHLLQLINDVLDLSRLESGQVALEHVPFNLRQVGEDALALVESQAVEAGLKTTSDHMDGTDVWLIGSPLHFKQVMLNLYTNAIKYNKPGGFIYTDLEAESRTEDTIILRITVKDGGIGMSQEFIEEKLFTPFMQEENGPRTRFKGSGIGMSIVKKIVDEMHGSIEVDSKVGEGTTFTVLLPFEIDHSSHTPEEPEDRQSDVAGSRILLVEDNELNMEIAEFILKDAGTAVTKAMNGKEAVELFAGSQEGSFDVILMDIMMPVMDGLEAARRIRSMERSDADIPIFAMTANAFSEDAQKSIEAGMNEHISKPIDAQKMLNLIAKYRKK